MMAPQLDGAAHDGRVDGQARKNERASVYAPLLRRADFLAAQRGAHRDVGFAAVRVRARADKEGAPRFGITVTKKIAPLAVERNRIKRRLRAALRSGAAQSALPGCDYVLIARRAALTASFCEIKTALAACLETPPSRARGHHRPSRP